MLQVFREVPRREKASRRTCPRVLVAVFVTTADSVALTRVGVACSSIAALDWRVDAALSTRVLIRLFAGLWWRADRGFWLRSQSRID